PTLLVINIFIPTCKTPFENCPVPSLEDVQKVLNKAHKRLTQTTMFLGCMRPFGKYRERLDIMAYEEGVKGFVKPTKPLVECVKKDGEQITTVEECCALI
ncbi:MAG: radical SAM protein, partial [Caldisericota bacterium]|nr:radical SAM protein [Caldisericota bacterium]